MSFSAKYFYLYDSKYRCLFRQEPPFRVISRVTIYQRPEGSYLAVCHRGEPIMSHFTKIYRASSDASNFLRNFSPKDLPRFVADATQKTCPPARVTLIPTSCRSVATLGFIFRPSAVVSAREGQSFEGSDSLSAKTIAGLSRLSVTLV